MGHAFGRGPFCINNWQENIMPIYKLRYGILKSKNIFNECGPYSGGKPGWDEDSIKSREVVALRKINGLNKQSNFYNNLEKSILKEGFKNPIIVNAGWCPKIRDRGHNDRLPLDMQEDHSKILSCNTNGGSRLWVAQNHDLDIPCIIVDYIDRFPEFPILETKDDILSCYKDQPEKIIIHKDVFRIRNLPQRNV